MNTRELFTMSLLFFFCLSCNNKEDGKDSESITLVSVSGRPLSVEEQIIRAHCLYLFAEDDRWHEPSIKTYTRVEEYARYDNIVVYELVGLVLNANDPPIECTNYFRINNMYVFIKQKNKPKCQVPEAVLEKIRDWNGITSIEMLTTYITINLKDYAYKVTQGWTYNSGDF